MDALIGELLSIAPAHVFGDQGDAIGRSDFKARHRNVELLDSAGLEPDGLEGHARALAHRRAPALAGIEADTKATPTEGVDAVERQVLQRDDRGVQEIDANLLRQQAGALDAGFGRHRRVAIGQGGHRRSD